MSWNKSTPAENGTERRTYDQSCYRRFESLAAAESLPTSDVVNGAPPRTDRNDASEKASRKLFPASHDERTRRTDCKTLCFRSFRCGHGELCQAVRTDDAETNAHGQSQRDAVASERIILR